MVEAYPLHWPLDYPTTDASKRKNSRFKTTLGAARDFVKDEIRRIGGKNPVISTNIPLKDNGDLRADWSRFKIDNPGVAVYFTYNGNQVCLCSDTYTRVWENLHGVGRTIAALRQINRDGVSDFLNRTFTGFKAIPEKATGRSCWDILDMEPTRDENKVHNRYRDLSKVKHPDSPNGSAELFYELQEARKQAIDLIKSGAVCGQK